MRGKLESLFTALIEDKDNKGVFCGLAPTVRLSRRETRFVTCPHCRVGKAALEIEVSGPENSVRIDGLNEARRCDWCEREFMVRPQVQYIGVPVEVKNDN